MRFTIDTTLLPVVVVTYPDTVTADDYRQLFEHYAILCEAHPRLAWLIDFQAFDPLGAPAPLRRAAADCFAQYRDPLLRVSICEARVARGTLSRGVLTAFDWLTGAKWPTRNFETRAEADRWIADHVQADGNRRSANG